MADEALRQLFPVGNVPESFSLIIRFFFFFPLRNPSIVSRGIISGSLPNEGAVPTSTRERISKAYVDRSLNGREPPPPILVPPPLSLGEQAGPRLVSPQHLSRSPSAAQSTAATGSASSKKKQGFAAYLRSHLGAMSPSKEGSDDLESRGPAEPVPSRPGWSEVVLGNSLRSLKSRTACEDADPDAPDPSMLQESRARVLWAVKARIRRALDTVFSSSLPCFFLLLILFPSLSLTSP